MRKCGEVTYTDAHYRSGEGRGEVCYASREEMERCLDEMDGFEINGKQIRVSQGVKALLFMASLILITSQLAMFYIACGNPLIGPF